MLNTWILLKEYTQEQIDDMTDSEIREEIDNISEAQRFEYSLDAKKNKSRLEELNFDDTDSFDWPDFATVDDSSSQAGGHWL